MAPVRAAHGGNVATHGARPQASRELLRGFVPRWTGGSPGAVMAGNQQHAPGRRAAIACSSAAVDRVPGLVEIEAVKVEDAVGLDIARPRACGPSCRRASRPGVGRAGMAGDRAADRRLRNWRGFGDRRLGFSWSRLRARSRDSGRIVAVTRAHSSASSGAERAHGRPCPWAAGSTPAPVADMPPAVAVACGPAPQKVSKRLAPLIAPPVSCATHKPSASGRSSVEEHRRAERHEIRIGGDRAVRRHRHVQARRAGPARSVP